MITTIRRFAISTAKVLIALCVLQSCRKDVPKGQLIKANGTVSDSVKNKILSGVKIYLYGAHQTFYGVFYDDGPLDSTFSDMNGNFSISYHAEGESVDYALAVGNDIYGGYSSQDNFVVDVYHPLYPFNYIHQLNNVELRARELNYSRIDLKVLSNPYDSIYVHVTSQYGEMYFRYLLRGNQIDTTIYSRSLPNSLLTLMYETQSRSVDSGWITRIERDSFQMKLEDTITISKTIQSAYEIPYSP